MKRSFDEKRSIQDILNFTLEKMRFEISNLEENRVLNGGSSEIVIYLSNKFTMDMLDIDFDQWNSNVVMVDVHRSAFPPGTDVWKKEFYPSARVDYTFTVKSKNPELIEVLPSVTKVFNPIRIAISGNEFTWSYQTQYANENLPEEHKDTVRKERARIITIIKKEVIELNKEIDAFNIGLLKKINALLEQKKDDIEKRRRQIDDLNRA